MKMKRLVSAIAALAMSVSAFAGMTAFAEETTTNVQGVATYINAGTPDTNFSDAGVVYANLSKISGGAFTDELSAYGGSDVALFKVDLSAYKSQIVKSVTLNLTSTCTTANKNSNVRLATSENAEWDEKSITWNTHATDLGAVTYIQDIGYADSNGDTFAVDVSSVFEADADGKLSFAFFTATGRQQSLTSLSVDVVTTTEELTPAGAVTVNYVVDGNVVQTATPSVEGIYKDESFTYYWPTYISYEGAYYKAVNTACSETITLTADAVTKDVEYVDVDSNIVYYSEAEVLENNIGATTGNYSNGAFSAVTGGKAATLTTLPAGIYNVSVQLVERGDRGIYIRNTAIADNNTNVIVTAGTDKYSTAGLYTFELTLTEETTIALTGYTNSNGKANQSSGIDYILIEKTGDYVAPAVYTGVIAKVNSWSGEGYVGEATALTATFTVEADQSFDTVTVASAADAANAQTKTVTTVTGGTAVYGIVVTSICEADAVVATATLAE